MRHEVIEKGWLRDPDTGRPLRADVFESDTERVVEAVLWDEAGAWYPVEDGLPCLLSGDMRPAHEAFRQKHGLPEAAKGKAWAEQREQEKTAATFSDKWRRFQNYGFAPSEQRFLQEWYVKKLGLDDVDALRSFYRDKHAILECGPGSGFNSRFMAEQSPGQVFCADISDAARTTFDNTKDVANCHAIQADLMHLPFADDTFDFVIADGVLHHTPSTRDAVAALYRKVKPGGQFFFYVYQQMGAARRFCDDHIRKAFKELPPEECYEACEGLTELGRELSKLGATIHLEKPIPVLGIPAGTHDVQRLIYYNFVKCFWSDDFGFETSNMVNFDWYHPHHAWQHTEDEVAGWLRDLGAAEFAFHPANPNGISALVRKS